MSPRRRFCPWARFFGPPEPPAPGSIPDTGAQDADSQEGLPGASENAGPEQPQPNAPPPEGEPGDETAGGGAPGPYGPPWMWRSYWRQGANWRQHMPGQTQRRFFFRRVARLVGLLMLIFLTGMAGLSFVLSRLFGGGRPAFFLVWLGGILVIIGVLFLAAALAVRSFTRSMEPLARVMSAAEDVSAGDLSVRVPEGARGEFGRLVSTFNHMVAELERVDQQRRNLTADVAHELRTPLHIIQGNLEGILDGVYQPTSEQIELLLDETRQLSRLVEDLRTLSLAESGQLPLNFETLDARELLEDVVTSFSGQAEAAGVDLRVEESSASGSSTTPLAIRGDAGRLDQVLSNLVANGLRHTPRGGWVRLSAQATPTGARLRVADNGSGIAPADLPFIFDRFWRADRARQHAGGGLASTGLGLAIARQLVQAHGGKISVESQPGQGAVFTIDIPDK